MQRTTYLGLFAAGLAIPALALPVAARADALVNGSGRTEMLDCVGANALVNGDNNRIMFHGDCRSLRVNGGGNVVNIELMPGGAVALTGDLNHVIYSPTEPGPVVTAQGSGNQVSAGTRSDAAVTLTPTLPDAAPPAVVLTPAPAMPAAATVVLDGEDQDRDIDCAGRNVLIHGSHGRFTLRGGCRAVSVQGRADRIQAELVPGAHVDIGGDAVTLNYTLTSDGPQPVVSVTGANSQATMYTHTSSSTVISQPGATTVIGSPAQ